MAEMVKGVMPIPYWTEQSHVNKHNQEIKDKFIVIDALNVDGVVKTFAWWRNMPFEGRSVEDFMRKCANQVTRVFLEWEIDAAIGPGIDLYSSQTKFSKGTVKLHRTSVGFYIDLNERANYGSLPLANMRGINEFRAEDPVLTDYVFRRALSVLPKIQNSTH